MRGYTVHTTLKINFQLWPHNVNILGRTLCNWKEIHWCEYQLVDTKVLLWVDSFLISINHFPTSAALPLYNRKWLHALRLIAIALSGNCCRYTAKTSWKQHFLIVQRYAQLINVYSFYTPCSQVLPCVLLDFPLHRGHRDHSLSLHYLFHITFNKFLD